MEVWFAKNKKLHVLDLRLPLECMKQGESLKYGINSEERELQNSEGLHRRNLTSSDVFSYINLLKKQLVSKRRNHIKSTFNQNLQNVVKATSAMYKSSERRHISACQSASMALQYNTAAHVGRTIKLRRVKLSPQNTTWVFLDRNQRLTEDPSLGRQQIYYDKSGGEALEVSDSNMEYSDVKKEKEEFSDSEDYILRRTVERYGLAFAVLDVLAHCFSTKPYHIKARYEAIVRSDNNVADFQDGSRKTSLDSSLEQGLNVAMDSFDTLFCRQCLLFNCGIHGCAQIASISAEKQRPMHLTEKKQGPCGSHCYKMVSNSEGLASLSKTIPQNHETNSNRLYGHGEEDQQHDLKCWKTMEKDLLKKGVEIFALDSCLIARNLMNGLKTCSEVFQFLNCSENMASHEEGNSLHPSAKSCPEGEGNDEMGTQRREKSRYVRRRGRVCRLKFTMKPSGYKSVRRQLYASKGELNHHYSPCGCKSACDEDCFCRLNGTYCEKYCGCPKSCKNRFRGCRCAKNQCRTRQCSCVAANRECDPDVCRNCYISCGDGTCGPPLQNGNTYKCMNMKILQKQHQRVLQRESDVSGYGAFLKNDCEKDEYIGEYTGELITHHEAEKRGDSPYLFDLNDQLVVDAKWMGNNLRFVNHSSNPNCYAKILLVAGVHRIGFFAKERIRAGQELFLDYNYKDDAAPAWAKDHNASRSKKDEDYTPSSSRGRRKVHKVKD